MRKQLAQWLWTGVVLLIAQMLQAQHVQMPGTDYLLFEAEDYQIDDLNDDEFGGWTIISTDDPKEVDLHNSNPGFITIPPPNANPSEGEAIFDLAGGGDFAHQIGYELQFVETGVYYLYSRFSAYDLRNIFTEDTYGNEDSVYLPVESIDQDPTEPILRDTRDGFSATNGGFGFRPSSGCRIDEEPWQIPEDECDFVEERYEGQYHWRAMNWNNGLGHANYEIEQAGVVFDFNIATREQGTSLDVLVLSQNPDLSPEDLDELLEGNQGDPCDFDGDGSLGVGDIDLLRNEIIAGTNNASFDVTGDGSVKFDDLQFFVEDASKLNTYIGDSNLDGEFNSGDFVTVFQAGQYEDGTPMNSTWGTGDWNADGDFTSGDFVIAFQSGGYEIGPRIFAQVPEPAGIFLTLLGGAALLALRRLELPGCHER